MHLTSGAFQWPHRVARGLESSVLDKANIKQNTSDGAGRAEPHRSSVGWPSIIALSRLLAIQAARERLKAGETLEGEVMDVEQLAAAVVMYLRA